MVSDSDLQPGTEIYYTGDMANAPGVGRVVEILPPERTEPQVDPVALYLARLAPRSRRTMLGCLNRLACMGGEESALALPWHRLRRPHTLALRARLVERYAPATARLHLAALRGVLRECWRAELMDREDYERAVDLPPVRGERMARGRALEPDELARLGQACRQAGGVAGVRDRALFLVLAASGMRRAEVVGLDLADLDAEAGTCRVRGKGGRERRAYLPEAAMRALEAWWAVRGRGEGPVFVALDREGRATRRRLSTSAVREIVARRARQAGLDPVAPHDLRRTFVTSLLEAGADLAVVSRLAGHAQLQTTRGYDRRGAQAEAKAAGALGSLLGRM